MSDEQMNKRTRSAARSQRKTGLARWERTYARLKRDLAGLREELPEVVREVGEAEWGIARVDAAVRRARSATPPPWDASDLQLRGVTLDRAEQLLTIRFATGARHELALRALRLGAPAIAAKLDDLRHAVALALEGGGVAEVASDLVLHLCDPAYRAAHQEAPAAVPLFGARIRAIRRTSGRTARAVAAAAGMAPSNYARLEASKHQPRVETLLSVARALGVTLEELVRAGPQPSPRRK